MTITLLSTEQQQQQQQQPAVATQGEADQEQKSEEANQDPLPTTDVTQLHKPFLHQHTLSLLPMIPSEPLVEFTLSAAEDDFLRDETTAAGAQRHAFSAAHGFSVTVNQHIAEIVLPLQTINEAESELEAKVHQFPLHFAVQQRGATAEEAIIFEPLHTIVAYPLL